jgi:hypothetical protein
MGGLFSSDESNGGTWEGGRAIGGATTGAGGDATGGVSPGTFITDEQWGHRTADPAG